MAGKERNEKPLHACSEVDKERKRTPFLQHGGDILAINFATLEAHDPLSKQPDYTKCAVRLRKKSRP